MTTTRFGTVIVDPPWPYRKVDGPNAGGYSIEHYKPLELNDLAGLPVGAMADYLFLWTTVAFVREAYDLVACWGFEAVSLLPWVKCTEIEPGREAPFKDDQVDDRRPDLGPAVGDVKTIYGVGYWFRGAAEYVLVAKRPGVRSIRTHAVGLLSANAHHSRKPDTLHELVEDSFPAPYAELFARRERYAWTALGNEIDGRDIREAIQEYAVPVDRRYPAGRCWPVGPLLVTAETGDYFPGDCVFKVEGRAFTVGDIADWERDGTLNRRQADNLGEAIAENEAIRYPRGAGGGLPRWYLRHARLKDGLGYEQLPEDAREFKPRNEWVARNGRTYRLTPAGKVLPTDDTENPLA